MKTEAAALRQKLAAYLAADADFRALYDYTKQRYHAATNLTAHNWEHTYRDIINAIMIGEAEGADMSIVLPAVTMHDIGFLYGAKSSVHGPVGADKLADFLKDAKVELDASKQMHIADCIRTHKGSAHDESPVTLEAKVVSDADMLDKFGPVGIYQITRVFTEFNAGYHRTIEAIDNPKRRFQTQTGHKLMAERKPFTDQFIRAFRQAYELYQEEPS